MKVLVPDIFQDFKCVGGDCLKTCCQGWNIIIDADTVKKYKNSDDPIAQEVLENLIPIPNSDDMKIKLDDDEKCPLLNEQGLCRLVLSKGDDYLGYVCQTYPRTIMRYIDTVFETVCSSCPEVAKMIVEKNDFVAYCFDEIYDNEKYEGADWTLYNEIINALVISTNILQHTDYSLSTRIEILMSLADIVDKHIANNTISSIRHRLNRFSDKSYLKTYASSSNKLSYHPELLIRIDCSKASNVPFYVKDYYNSHSIESAQKEMYNSLNDFIKVYNPLEYTNLSILLIFEYYMNTIKGDSLKYNLIKMVVLIYLIQQFHLYDYTTKQNLYKEDNILGISIASSLVKHSSLLDNIATSLEENPDLLTLLIHNIF